MSAKIVELDELNQEVTAMIKPLMGIEVIDVISTRSAIEAGKQVKSWLSKIETCRKNLVDPHVKEQKRINAYAKTVSAPLEQAEAHVKRELVKYEVEQEKLRQLELKKLEEERKKKELELAEKQQEIDLFGAEDSSLVEERSALFNQIEERKDEILTGKVKNTFKTLKCELENIELVPKEFLIISLNEKAVLAAAKAGVKIPGVRVWEETSVRLGFNTKIYGT